MSAHDGIDLDLVTFRAQLAALVEAMRQEHAVPAGRTGATAKARVAQAVAQLSEAIRKVDEGQ